MKRIIAICLCVFWSTCSYATTTTYQINSTSGNHNGISLSSGNSLSGLATVVSNEAVGTGLDISVTIAGVSAFFADTNSTIEVTETFSTFDSFLFGSHSVLSCTVVSGPDRCADYVELGNFELGGGNFTAIGDGMATLAFQLTTIDPSFLGIGGTYSRSYELQQVPIPGATWLFLSASAGLLRFKFLRRR